MIKGKVIYIICPFLFAFWAVIRVRNPIRGKKKNPKNKKQNQKYYLSSKMPAK